MVEVIFVLLTVYVAYVVQSVIFKGDSKKSASSPQVKPAIMTEAVKRPTQKVVVEKAKPVTKKTTAKKPPVVKSTTKVKPKPVTANLRNPETGDVDKIATSYRMTKRWIKEALVTEELLPKIYKTAELDEPTKSKINKALVKLAKMDKYK